MRILADENIHAGLIKALRDRGFSVSSCHEVGLLSAEDKEYVERIVSKGELLLTADKGFGLLQRFSWQEGESRILLLRILPFNLEEAIEKSITALETIHRDYPAGPLMAVLTRNRLRIRSGLLP
jgi:predicted nuclease of predicted toxin-antitoxin system